LPGKLPNFERYLALGKKWSEVVGEGDIECGLFKGEV